MAAGVLLILLGLFMVQWSPPQVGIKVQFIYAH